MSIFKSLKVKKPDNKQQHDVYFLNREGKDHLIDFYLRNPKPPHVPQLLATFNVETGTMNFKNATSNCLLSAALNSYLAGITLAYEQRNDKSKSRPDA